MFIGCLCVKYSQLCAFSNWFSKSNFISYYKLCLKMFTFIIWFLLLKNGICFRLINELWHFLLQSHLVNMAHYMYYSLSLIRFLFALLQFRFVRSLTNRASLRRPWINVFIKCQFRENLSPSLHTMIITIRIYVSFSSETYVINAFFPPPLLFQFIRGIFLNTCSKI